MLRRPLSSRRRAASARWSLPYQPRSGRPCRTTGRSSTQSGLSCRVSELATEMFIVIALLAFPPLWILSLDAVRSRRRTGLHDGDRDPIADAERALHPRPALPPRRCGQPTHLQFYFGHGALPPHHGHRGDDRQRIAACYDRRCAVERNLEAETHAGSSSAGRQVRPRTAVVTFSGTGTSS